jgi:hypothetical protein
MRLVLLHRSLLLHIDIHGSDELNCMSVECNNYIEKVALKLS